MGYNIYHCGLPVVEFALNQVQQRGFNPSTRPPPVQNRDRQEGTERQTVSKEKTLNKELLSRALFAGNDLLSASQQKQVLTITTAIQEILFAKIAIPGRADSRTVTPV